jgi:hypothetical protein
MPPEMGKTQTILSKKGSRLNKIKLLKYDFQESITAKFLKVLKSGCKPLILNGPCWDRTSDPLIKSHAADYNSSNRI